MVTPMIGASGPTGGGLSTSATNRVPFFESSVGSSYGASDGRGSPIAIPGTVSKLSVRMPAGIGTGTYTVFVNKGSAGSGTAANTALTCAPVGSPAVCSDSTHSFSVVAGDVLSIEFVPATTPTANTVIQWSAIFTSTNNGESFIVSPYSSLASASAVNYQGFAASLNPNATENIVSSVVATGGTIDHLYVNASTSPGAAKSYAVALCKNGTCTSSPNCSITGAGGAASLSCNDLVTAGLAVVAGDTISVQITPTGTPTTSGIQAGFRWVPTTAGEALAFNSNAGTSGNVNQFLNFNGNGPGATETNFYTYAPSTSFTVKKLQVVQSTAPGGTATHTITMRANAASVGTPGSLACTMTSALTSCSDSTNSYSTSAADLLALLSSAANSPAAMTYLKIGTVMTVP